MKDFGKRLFFISLVLAAITAYLAFMYLQSGNKATVVEIEKIKVWTAIDEIKPRRLVDAKMIEEVLVPKTDETERMITDKGQIIGKYTKYKVLKGEGFRSEKLVEDYEFELSLKLKTGHRAYSMTISESVGVADLINPGDRIDIFLFLGARDGAHPEIARLLLQDVEVLAIKQNFERVDAKGSAVSAEEKKGSYAITYSIPFDDVETLFLAESIGEVKLALRPLKGDNYYSSLGTTWEQLLINENAMLRSMEHEFLVEEDINKILTSQVIYKPINEATGDYETVPIDATTETEGEEIDPEVLATISDELQFIVYKVRYGDTLTNISRRFYDGDGSKYILIREINDLESDKIVAGQILKIPVIKRSN